MKLEVMRKAPEPVVYERMLQGEGVKGVPKRRRRKYQDGLAEEMKRKTKQ